MAVAVNTGGSPAPITVVIVDDHVVFAQSLSRLLADDRGLSVVAMSVGGEGAKDAVTRHRPDVVLMDNALPDAVGTDVAAEIRALSPATRVVMLTASEDQDVLLAAIDAGCSGYVTKLQPVSEVLAAVRAAHVGDVVMSPPMLAKLLPLLQTRNPAGPRHLSPRELEILGLLSEGLTNTAIAERTYLSTNTVRNHVQSVLTKLGAHSKLEAVSVGVREGLIPCPKR